ncbi:MAG TPA: DUF3021 family protein [Bacilli bacterium]|jgi:hypothetical protein|nr:MAG: hypothetical protein BWX94_00906 [Tenericutes bacterium ADurb.Bin140]HOE78416.1 DUF3021 family protein [Bacilli bacterium]HOR95609.1 DUF3021 family protein [Bacilli bacterium]HPK58324.1 DUF3021 family protein [Bacilli bacterium]HPN90479.1 DUF3021 family protein [Bacilli bacterium]
MKSNRLKHFIQFVATSAVIFSILFAVTIGVYIIVQSFVFKQKIMQFSDLILSTGVLLCVSVGLNFFYRINRITIFFQVLCTYLVLIVFMYFMGFLLGWFSFNNLDFLLTCLLIHFLGGFLVTLGIVLKRNFEFSNLNRRLSEFKGRGKK